VQQIYSIAVHELVRQISANCMERGVLLGKIWNHMVSMVAVLVNTARSADDRVREHRISVESELSAWADAHEQLTAELEAAKEQKNTLEVQQIGAEADRRDLEHETMRVERLVREMQKTSEEVAGLHKQLHAMHQVNASQQTANAAMIESSMQLKQALADVKKSLATASAELEDERTSHERTKKQLQEAQQSLAKAHKADADHQRGQRGDLRGIEWSELLAAAEAAGKLQLVSALSLAGRTSTERIACLLELASRAARPGAAPAEKETPTKVSKKGKAAK